MGTDYFIDYYEDLQVNLNADFETVERVYRLLAKKYHPDNRASGDAEKFNIISAAYRTISDPEKRAAYDAGYEEARTQQDRALSEASLSEDVTGDRRIRQAILSILYRERRQAPADSGVGLWRLEKLLGWPEKILEFHTWYLKEKDWIRPTDTGGYAITASGVDVVEGNELILGQDRLLPYTGSAFEDSANARVKEVQNDQKVAGLRCDTERSGLLDPSCQACRP